MLVQRTLGTRPRRSNSGRGQRPVERVYRWVLATDAGEFFGNPDSANMMTKVGGKPRVAGHCEIPMWNYSSISGALREKERRGYSRSYW